MVTVTVAGPTAPDGDTAVIDASELTVKLAAAVPPKLTAVAPVKLTPLIVTVVPPALVPAAGVSCCARRLQADGNGVGGLGVAGPAWRLHRHRPRRSRAEW